MRCLKMCHLAVHTHSKHVHTRYKSCQKMGHLDRDVLSKDVSSWQYTHKTNMYIHDTNPAKRWVILAIHTQTCTWIMNTHIQRSPATCKFVCSFWIVMVHLNMGQIVCWYWTNWDQVTLGYICVRTSDELAQSTNLRSKPSKLFSRSSTSML